MQKRKFVPIGLMIHCSDSTFGDVNLIKKWHTDPVSKGGRGWLDVGYNWIICNGILGSRSKYDVSLDGLVQEGRDVMYEGAHAKGYNTDYLSVCLIGKNHFTYKQITNLYKFIKQMTVANIIQGFIVNKPLSDKQIMGHYEVDSKKTCPCIDMDEFRKQLNLNLVYEGSEFSV